MEKVRPSPNKSATLYKVGIIKTGNDGNKWIIVENKNGVKKWQKHKIVTKKEEKTEPNKDKTKEPKKDKMKESKKDKMKEPTNDKMKEPIKEPIKDKKEEINNIISKKDLEKEVLKNDTTNYIYKILTTKIIPEINKLKIKTFIVPLPLSYNNIYWTDFPPDYIKETYNEYLYNINYIYFTFFMNYGGTEINLNKNIKIHFSNFNKEIKIKIIDIFEKYLFGYYIWNGSNNTIMEIMFNKNNNIKYIDKLLIKNEDKYPSLFISIYSNIDFDENKNISNKLIKFVEKTFVNYDLIWEVNSYNIFFTINSFDDKKIIEKLKTYIKSQTNIKKTQFYFMKNKDSEEEIWSYKS
jgi:hypothetical protein